MAETVERDPRTKLFAALFLITFAVVVYLNQLRKHAIEDADAATAVAVQAVEDGEAALALAEEVQRAYGVDKKIGDVIRRAVAHCTEQGSPITNVIITLQGGMIKRGQALCIADNP